MSANAPTRRDPGSQADKTKRRMWKEIVSCFPFNYDLQRQACLKVIERFPPKRIAKELTELPVVGKLMRAYLTNIKNVSYEGLQKSLNSGPIKLRMKKHYELQQLQRQLVQQRGGNTRLIIFLRMRYAAEQTKKEQGRRACS